MKWLDNYIVRLALVGIACYSLFTVPKLLAKQALETSDNDQESSEVVITIAGQEYRYQPRPDLGYVVLAENDSDAIASVYGDLSLFTQNEIESIGGRDRQGLWIVENRQSAVQNEAAIKTLSARGQVQYVAPLFSRNGETEAIIPEIVVRVTVGTGQQELEQICRVLNLRIKRRMMFTEQEYLVDVLGENADAVLTALIELNQMEFVEWAAPNVITQRRRPEAPVLEIDNSGPGVSLYDAQQNPWRADLLPDDAFFPSMWHLYNEGQFGGTPGADINAIKAWEITTGDPNIIVCIQDTGVDLDHPDLVNNLVPGHDFYDNDDLPEPIGGADEAHGTACAGLVAAEGNNDVGVVGVAWNCRVMPTRDGTYSRIPVAGAAEGFRWAAANGADVLSYSGGWSNPQPIIYSAIVDITKPGGIGRDGKGCVVLVASGNTGGRIPAADTSAYPEVIGVGATDQNDVRWPYSCYGPELDIVAPSGQRSVFLRADPGRWSNEASMLLSTDIAGPPGLSSDPAYKYDGELDYCFFGGTSGACPIAAGVAALILSIEPEFTNEEVRHFLTRSAKDLGDPGRDDYYGWGRVDARAALDMVLAKRCDLNNDWKVDDQDLTLLNQYIAANDLSGDIAPPAKRDGIVDEQDLGLLMQYIGTEIPELGVIAHWKLDEEVGNIAYDSVGAKDATVLGDPVWQPKGGMVDGAITLDGADDYIEAPSVLNPADGAFSVFAWIKGGIPGQAVLSQANNSNWLCLDSGGCLMTELKAKGRGAGPLLSQTSITDGAWHRIGLVWDGSYRHLYVDGVEVAKDAGPLAGLEAAKGGLYFGAGSTLTPGTFFSGLIDDIRIYNRTVNP